MKTMEELRAYEAAEKKKREDRKAFLLEKSYFAILTPGISDNDLYQEVLRLDDLEEKFTEYDGFYKGKIEIVKRTNRWFESLPQID